MWNKLLEILHIRKKPKNDDYVPEPVPEIENGYHDENDTIVRLVSNKKIKHAYKTTGIEDVVSKNNWKAWIYLAPVLVLIAIFLIYPLVNTFFIAFAENYVYADGTFSGMTFKHFVTIFTYEKFYLYALPNTLFLTFVTVPISIFLALIISVALNSIKWFQKTLQTVFFLPYVTNAIAVGMVFSVMFDKTGIINSIFHSNIDWMKEQRWIAMVPLCIYIVWHSLPFKILILLSGLQGVDKQYYQAAQIDSCPRWKVLFKITVPLLSPQILYIMITSFIGSFKEYTSVVGLFNAPETQAGTGNMMTVVYFVYDTMQDPTLTSIAAAAAVFLFIVILLFTALQFAVSKKKVHY